MSAMFSPEQRRYLFLQNMLGAAFVNLLINGALGWLITRGLAVFPLWGFPGAAVDLAATGFGVTFGTCVAARVGVSWDVGRGRIAPPVLLPQHAAWFRRLPANTFSRSLWLGLLSLPTFVLPLLLLLAFSEAPALERTAFIWLKAGFSAVQAAIVTPLIVLAVLFDISRRVESTARS
jgi:hypothetical protein